MIGQAYIKLADIRVRDRMREADEAKVEALAESMKERGLLQPIVVTATKQLEAHDLIAGLHRLRAAESLGWEMIAVVLREARTEGMNAEALAPLGLTPELADHRLAEIDENLRRHELTALQRAEQTAERKAIYEALNPTAPRGPGRRKKAENNEGAAPAFTTDTARKVGGDETAIRRDVQIGQGLTDETKALVRGTPLEDNKRDLIQLARIRDPEIQAKVAEMATKTKKTAGVVAHAKKAIDNAKVAETAAAAAPELEGVDLRLCDVADLLADPALQGTAELIHADPPWLYDRNDRSGAAEGAYDVSAMEAIVSQVEAAYDVAGPNARMLLWCTDPLLRDWFMASKDIRWRYVSAGGWLKTTGVGTGKHWRGDHEPLLMYVKGSPTMPLKVISNAHQGPRTKHSEKPVHWLEALIANLTAPGALVVDLYAGLAPTASACLVNGRRYVGAEIDEARHAQALAAIASR